MKGVHDAQCIDVDMEVDYKCMNGVRVKLDSKRVVDGEEIDGPQGELGLGLIVAERMVDGEGMDGVRAS